ncbi:l-lactate permease domain protein [Clostridium sp. CAG:505]|nr:l-lactate permease domain protein [Clostridium sp. CAG:505]
MLQLFMAISPILIVMIGIVGLKKPATIVSAIALIYTIFVTMFYGNFKLENDVLFSETTKGIIEGAKMVFMIWSAFLILNMLINTGAMDKIKEIIANLTLDKRKQFIIIAFCFGGFLEGVAGAGTPAAIAAPFLVLLVSHLYLRLLAHLFLMELPHPLGQRG